MLRRSPRMATLKFREAQSSDIPAMARIRAEEWETEEYWNKRIRAYMAGELDPKFALKPRVTYVCCEGDLLVGFIAGHITTRHGCHGELEWINVIREKRGGGAASGLLRELAKWFVAQNALRICVDVEPSNTVARRFYARYGAEDLKSHWMMWNDIRTVLADRSR